MRISWISLAIAMLLGAGCSPSAGNAGAPVPIGSAGESQIVPHGNERPRHHGFGRDGVSEAVLYDFPSPKLASSEGGPVLVGPSGALFGVALSTTNGHAGTIFRLNKQQQLDVLATFPDSGSYYDAPDGYQPTPPLVRDSAGNLYGTAFVGGPGGGCIKYWGCGTVWEAKQVGSSFALKILHGFTDNGTDGYVPMDGLTMDSSGNLYGTTYYGGKGKCSGGASPQSGCGTVFKLTPSGSGFLYQKLYDFEGGSDGANPSAGLFLGAGGVLYGATQLGGPDDDGTLFQLTPGASSFTYAQIYAFTGGANTDGAVPAHTPYVDSSGAIYGSTWSGGTPGCTYCGTLFKIVGVSGNNGQKTYKEQWVSPFSYFADPSGVIADSSGELYSTTLYGGTGEACCGTVLKTNPATGVRTIIYAFTGAPDGAMPAGGLSLAGSDVFVGVTISGGTGGNCDFYNTPGCGTIFQISTAASFERGHKSVER